MSKISKIIDRAEQTCTANGTRLTEKRKHVLTGLLKSQKALSAYELVEFCRHEFNEAIPPMSVYRILDFLESENLVHKLHVANKYVACSHISCDHAHEISQFLICDECGSVREVGIKKSLIDTLKRTVEASGYFLKSPQMELHCLCRDCAARAA